MDIVKLQQLNRAIQRIVSNTLRELNEEGWSSVTISHVTINPAATVATVWLYATPEQMRQIDARAHEIQYQLMKQLPRRSIPKLIFKLKPEDMERLEQGLEEL